MTRHSIVTTVGIVLLAAVFGLATALTTAAAADKKPIIFATSAGTAPRSTTASPD
jgi:hypothetical protein